MSGLFKRLSSRRSAGPEGTEPPTAAEPGTADAPANTPAEPEGRQPLFTDPAAPTSVLREGDPLASPVADPNQHTLFGPPAEPQPAAPATPVDPAPYAAPNPYVAPIEPAAPAPLAAQPYYQPPVGPGVPIEPVADLPAGLDPDELAGAPATSARRGKIRRRVAFLRAARELLLRDLGGFVYELHRTAHDVEHEAHRRLRETKLARLSRVDAELHELEVRLDDVRRQVLVREPGVGGECPHCGELFGSAAHYCSNCGLPLTEGARRELARSQQPVPEPVIAPEPAPEPVITPVANADQPTQELATLDPDHPNAGPEFQWPRRESTQAESSWATTPSNLAGDVAPSAEETAASEADATPEPAAEAAEPVAADETPAPAASEPGATTPEPAAAEETPAPAASEGHDATPEPTAADETPVPAELAEATPESATADETPEPAAETPEPAAATPDDAAPQPPAADATPVPAASEPDDATPEPAAAGDNGTLSPEPSSEDDDAATAARNGSGHDDSILRPVERRP